ncbi:envelope protein [Hipposideros bat coronavirus]|nr:envelope protein [Hipposideros bat coronavirus]
MYSLVSPETGTFIVNVVLIFLIVCGTLILSLAILTTLRLCLYACSAINFVIVKPSAKIYVRAKELYDEGFQIV